ncbi:hypothetical protein [Roseovarius aestuarii]|uniref:Uncharacterized protein n=1 Tax=Roseovarius aestuarii TaxID=475083 RepID=A0A1X7BP17_9RHOB|nr:hypothetical protein [Roseovarius aestuarii]SMC11362.1 hypothetical protein ROA7745_01174 [Roseovarius aestuarii]
MTGHLDVTGEWVEIAEEGGDDTVVFLRQGPDIPPSRGGRRQLHLKYQGEAGAEAPGPTDKSESAGTGGWFRDGTTLHIRVPGWEGDYDIVDVQDTRLVLRRR